MADTEGGNIFNDLVAKAKEVGEQVKEFAEDAFDNVKEFAAGADEKGHHDSNQHEDGLPDDQHESAPEATAEAAESHTTIDGDQPLSDDRSSDLKDDRSSDLKDDQPATADAGVNDFGSGSDRPVRTFGDTEASALDAAPEGPDAQTSKPLS